MSRAIEPRLAARDSALQPRLVCLLLALGTLLLYLPVRQHGFVVYDDPDYVTENRVVQAGLTWGGIQWAFTTWQASNWHPLTWLSHMLDCELFGLNAGAQHLVNVLFHTANSLLLLLVLHRMTRALWPSAFVAALFAWHPLHVESVAWLAERKDVLSTLFGLLTLWAYTQYVQGLAPVTQPPGPVAPRSQVIAQPPPSSHFRWLAVLFLALGLLAKPMLVTLPFVLLLLDYWPLRRIPTSAPGPAVAWRLVLEKWPFFLLIAASCVVTFLSQRAEAVVPFDRLPLGLRLENALVAYARYVLSAGWPADLAVLYPLPQQLPGWQVLAAAAFLAALSVGAWFARRVSPCLLVGWLWFLGTLVPVIGLVQVGDQARADRYTYLPMIGLFIAVAFGVRDLAARFHLRPLPLGLAAGVALGGCLVATTRQLRFWKDSESLFTHAIAVTTNNAVAHINLGFAFQQQGRSDAALTAYRTAVAIAPRRAQAHNNLGVLLDELGQRDAALAEYQEALRLKPAAPLTHLNLGTLLVALGRFEDARRHYDEAARLSPEDPRPFYLMGKARLRQGASAGAIADFRAAQRLDPNDFQTLTLLARVLASDEAPARRNGIEAVALAERANTLTAGTQPFVLDTLAMAYAEAGLFPDAQRSARAALQLAAAAGMTTNGLALQQRLQGYEAGRPCRAATTNLLGP
jgi:tetratricopeptide (TPR) repeat protein